MSTDILEQRKRCFSAWNATLARARVLLLLPHPRHEREFGSALSDEPGEPFSRMTSDLSLELAAWEEASDEDFERFEQSLE